MRNPTGVEGHDPVDGGEGDGESVEDEAGAADGFEALAVIGSVGAVGLFREFREQEGEEVPDCKIEDGANDEAVDGEVGLRDLLEVLAEVLVLDVAERLRPNVEMANPENDGDEEKGEQWERAHGRAQDAANDSTPTAAGEVADHDNRHGAEGDTEPAHEAEKICAIELVGTEEGESGGNHGEDDADDERALRNLRDDCGRRQIELWSSGGAHLLSSFAASDCGAASITGRVAPEPGWPRNFGGSDGKACPAGTSALVAF